ncbi:MAG TPA: hypothetical protein PKE04_15005, partial [Clostridia bacterium]|nr:hypothetical protein [Clostridia bacterium]
MWMAIGLAGFLLVSALIFLALPYSPTAARFQSATEGRIQARPGDPEPFSQEDIRDLPDPVQKYFQYCGYLGTPKMSYMKASLTGVDFYM